MKINKKVKIKLEDVEIELNRISLFDSIEIQKKIAVGISQTNINLDNFDINTIMQIIASNFEILEFIFEIITGKTKEELKKDETLTAGMEWEIIENYHQHPDLKRLVENIKKTMGKMMKS